MIKIRDILKAEGASNLAIADYLKRKAEWYNQLEGNLNEIDGYDCKVCKNKGYVAVVNNGEEIHKFCKCQKIREMLKKARKSGLANVITEYTFDKFNVFEDWQKDMLNKAKAFCQDDENRWFYIGGQSGSGKTHICTAITANYIKQGYDALYMIWAEDAKILKAIVNDKSYFDEINKYKTVDVLYIDDFLKTRNGEQPTNADINLAFEILNSRLISNKTTIISSERTLYEIMDYDEATMSRIFQKANKYNISVSKDRTKNYRLIGNLELFEQMGDKK